ncbi:MAG TPA: hypothetical protein VH369_24425, partial [Bryobacteraceae bacterium]
LKSVGVSRVSGLGILAALLGLQLKADVIYNVTIDDPDNLLAGYDDLLRSTLIEAGNDWSKYLSIQPGTTTINIGISANTSIPRATGASSTSDLVSILPDGTRVYEQRTGGLYRTGSAPFGSQPDAIVSISPGYMKNELSFAAVTPSNRTDALSVFRHELGHAIGINGFLSLTSGAVPSDSVGNFESTYDQYIVFASDGTPWFTGTAAEQVYGDLFNGGLAAPVPLTMLGGSQALYHIGNGDISTTSCPTNGLLSDLMNGVVFCRGQRYEISELDLAILKDTGLTVDFIGKANSPVPEPSCIVVVIAALIIVRLYVARDRKGQIRAGKWWALENSNL